MRTIEGQLSLTEQTITVKKASASWAATCPCCGQQLAMLKWRVPKHCRPGGGLCVLGFGDHQLGDYRLYSAYQER